MYISDDVTEVLSGRSLTTYTLRCTSEVLLQKVVGVTQFQFLRCTVSTEMFAAAVAAAGGGQRGPCSAHSVGYVNYASVYSR